MPNNCVFLVDTYDTLQGVRNAIEAGRWLRAQGHEMIGIRLDSGDLAYLSSAARRMLDEAGFPNAAVLASNDLDEHLIAGLKQQGATIGVWGVGTRLVTAFNQPAIDGVYKLSAIREPGGAWQDCLKLSEHAGKMSDPGILQVRRFVADGRAMADAIFDERHEPEGDCTIVDPDDATRRKHIAAGRETGTGSAAVRTDKGRNQSAAVPVPVSSAQSEDLLVPVFRGGRRVYDVPPLTESRERTQRQLALFHAGIKRFVNPHEYPAGLEERLHERKLSLIRRARRQENSTP
jgi:nicotinate phosphoribosyltransferase